MHRRGRFLRVIGGCDWLQSHRRASRSEARIAMLLQGANMITKEAAAESGERTAVTKRLAMIFADFAGTSTLVAKVGDLLVVGALQEFFRRSYHLQTIHHG